MVSLTVPADIANTVRAALEEDIGSGDLTSLLIAEESVSSATVICREDAVMCGSPWFNEVYRQLDPELDITWKVSDGDLLQNGKTVCTLKGPARSMLTGERTALNYIQLLSATATATRKFQVLIAGTATQLLDTRKTVPGLRSAQKYAVVCGGGRNHRMGLYDAILIKENHISAAGSIANALKNARLVHNNVEIEVETLGELQQALDAGADQILLDNFDVDMMRQAVKLTAGRAKLEASGGVNRDTIRAFAETGVDYISVGALTKDVNAIDFSMRVDMK